MAGRGPAPKDPSRRARRNADPVATLVLEYRKVDSPPLPADFDWHPRTVLWWASWTESAQAATFGPTDWAYLIDTARIHHELWSGDLRVAAELRLRSGKFGATPEDRARLRWRTEEPPEAAPEAPPAPGSRAKSRWGALHVVDGAAGA